MSLREELTLHREVEKQVGLAGKQEELGKLSICSLPLSPGSLLRLHLSWH